MHWVPFWPVLGLILVILFYIETIHCKKINYLISLGKWRYRLSFVRIVNKQCHMLIWIGENLLKAILVHYGTHFGDFWVLFGALLGTLLAPLNTPGNLRNSGETLCPTFSRFWGAQGGLRGSPLVPNRGAKFSKMLQEEPTKAPMWPQMRLFRSHWTLFGEPNCKNVNFENIENPSSFSLPNEETKTSHGTI